MPTAKFRSIWIRGRRHILDQAPQVDLRGHWDAALQIGGAQVDAIDFESATEATITAADRSTAARSCELRGRQVDLTFDAADLGSEGIITLNAIVRDARMFGSGIDATGQRFGWSARRTTTTPATGDDETAEPRTVDLSAALPLPFGAYGLVEPPAAQMTIVRNATIWTAGSAGILEAATLITDRGVIVYIGPNDHAPVIDSVKLGDAAVIDGSGLHLTPGLIDCHSHTGISKGLNEGTQAVTSEVRIADVLDPDDIGWYRELAGGLTTVNQLHGSANPIGGQNSVVKLRWGVAHPDAMRLESAPAGIKFALGENVKQSNWGDRYTTRYPQTRMGVEALLRDRFNAAKTYATAQASGDPTLRRDLELDALAEILSGERLVHCHSYRQDEILMLCRIAEEFNFTIGTFQHALECYKVAESVRKAARGASIFTDWWAYKFEVFDAIPENGAILHEVGVVTSFNSDSNELARRHEYRGRQGRSNTAGSTATKR